jgi:hypothetical protein
LEDGSWETEVGKRKLEDGSWKMEVGRRKWETEVRSDKFIK